jgi:hypothetical protein
VKRALIHIFCLCAALLLAGCGTLPPNVGKTDSSALPLDPASPLVRIAVSSIPAPEQTGVRLPRPFAVTDEGIPALKAWLGAMDVVAALDAVAVARAELARRGERASADLAASDVIDLAGYRRDDR